MANHYSSMVLSYIILDILLMCQVMRTILNHIICI